MQGQGIKRRVLFELTAAPAGRMVCLKGDVDAGKRRRS